MSRMLFIMHHITLCTLCIAIANGGCLLHIRVDYAEPELNLKWSKSNGHSEVHKRQVARKLILL
jgi:hypothetical protein